MKIKHGITLGGVFPGIFSRWRTTPSAFYAGKPTSQISPVIPPGVVKHRERFVKSELITLPRRQITVLHPRAL